MNFWDVHFSRVLLKIVFHLNLVKIYMSYLSFSSPFSGIFFRVFHFLSATVTTVFLLTRFSRSFSFLFPCFRGRGNERTWKTFINNVCLKRKKNIWRKAGKKKMWKRERTFFFTHQHHFDKAKYFLRSTWKTVYKNILTGKKTDYVISGQKEQHWHCFFFITFFAIRFWIYKRMI